MFIPRRVAAFGLLSLLAAALFAAVEAQPTDEQLSESALRGKLEAAVTASRAADWRTATTALDEVLSVEPDVRLTVPHQLGDTKLAVAVWAHQEAERLLAALPAEGRRVYEQRFGALAAAALKAARAQNDTVKMQRVVVRYLYTSAGVEALQELATYHLDRGRYDLAALHYESLLRHRGLARWTPPQLIQAAIAFHHADQVDNAAIVGRELLDRAGDGTFPLGLTRAEMQKELDKLAKAATLTEWRLFGGNPARNGRALGGLPVLTAEWRQPLTRTTEVENWLQRSQQILTERGQPLLSSAVPVATVTNGRDGKEAPMVLFRSHWGIHGVNTNTGKLRWETPSSWSMDRMVRDTKKVSVLNKWAGKYLEMRPNTLLDNSTVGTLSTDGAYVYMIEDLEVPPTPAESLPKRGRDKPEVNYGDPSLRDAVYANRMMAFDVAVGKLRWESGGTRKQGEKPEPVDLTDGYFLGVPLPLDLELYTVLEKAHRPAPSALLLAAPTLAAVDDLRDTREVYLAVLDARTGRGESLTRLFTHRHSLLEMPWRRGQTVQLAYNAGVLVCCAQTGTIVGYDRYKKRLLWSYTYHDSRDDRSSEDATPGPAQFHWAFGSTAARLSQKSKDKTPGWAQGTEGHPLEPVPVQQADVTAPLPQWHVTAPIIADGKVVFTAADSPTLTCLELRSGALRWSVPRGADDLYLAGVFHGRALVVGKGYVRAVALADGKQAWRTTTGLPSGLGAFTETQYYLPLQSAGPNKEPEIAVLDADKGTLVAHVRGLKKVVPGNLVFFHDHLLSQTPTELVAFPLLEAQLKRIDAALKKKPTDPAALSQRALLRQNKGELAAAADDLRTALKNEPPKEQREPMRGRLFKILTELLRQDFDKNEQYLKECEDLCAVAVPPAAPRVVQEQLRSDSRQRRLTFLVVAAKGRERQGKVSDALRYYLDLAALDNGELVPLATDPALKVRLDRWAQGRLEELLKQATPEQRRQLEEEMLERWKKSKTK